MRRAHQASARGRGRGNGSAHGNNWRQLQQQQQHPPPPQQQQHQQHTLYHQQYAQPAPPPPMSLASAPHHSTGMYAHAHAPPQMTASASVAGGARAGIHAEVTTFVEGLRASRSHPSAPPNALSVTAAAHAICMHFQVGDLEELLGATPLQLPALRQLQALNQRVWTFVTCFVQSRRVNTLFECFQAFLAHEGLREFHELRMGNSFVHTDAVQALYHAPTAMLNVSTRDVLTHLRQFEMIVGHDAFRHSSHIDRAQFLQYLAQQFRQPSVETLGVALDPAGFGVYIGLLRRIANQEAKELKTLEQDFQKGIAEKVFEVTKDKFSAENRKRALDELLRTHLRSNVVGGEAASGSSADDAQLSKPRAGSNRRSTMASLSLEMLKRVTEIDVYLDNVLRRKAAAAEQHGSQRQISSQEIAETDVKIRNQLTRFLMGTQKSKHHSRIKVVTWVLCGIMAKIHALLLHDDKLPEDKSVADDDDAETERDAKRPRLRKDDNIAADDGDGDGSDDECDCCCVGKDTCKCACACECHSLSSDEGDASDDDDKSKTKTKMQQARVDAAVAQSGATTLASPVAASKTPATLSAEDIEALKHEAEQYLTSYCESNEITSLEHLLMCFVSLEIHLQHERALDWSTLELILNLWSDNTHASKTWHEAFTRLVETPRSSGHTAASARMRAEVAQFVQQCYASASTARVSTSEALEQVTARARCEFGADTLEALGIESLDALLEDASGDDGGCVVRYSNVLLAASELPCGSAVAPGESLRATKVSEAIAALRASPFLVDVAKHTQWQQRFAPSCGTLRSFICAHEMILRDHAPSSVLFLFAWNGVVVRVNDASTPSALELLVSGGGEATATGTDAALPAAHEVAVHLVSMLVKCDGQLNFPKQLVQAHLRTLFVALDVKAESLQLPRYVLDVLLTAPLEFADFLFALLAEAACAASDTSSASAYTRLAHRVWEACASDIERRELAAIANVSSSSNGGSSSSAVWADRALECGAAHRSASASTTDAASSDVAASSISLERIEMLPPATERELIVDRFARAQQLDVLASAIAPAPAPHEPSTTSDTLAAAQPESCRACIEQIRREQFGIGLAVLDDATASVLAIQQQRLERALKRLSDELYSENTHFVLELLQNADDNSYAPHVRARGAFTLTARHDVVFHNNERGFSRANIHAICDVGASTKAMVDSSASIGKKGIGFKSVFKISDRPEVHSNGFHIRFHASQGDSSAADGGGLGYILPFWIDDETQWQQQPGTTFVLPLNAASRQRVDEISESLLAFEPSILLFLRRIEELCIADDVHNQRLHFLKEATPLSSSHARVQLFSQISRKGRAAMVVAQQQWIVVKRTLRAPAAFGGDRVRETELALALPLESVAGGGSGSGDRPPLQQVFAYLPLRSYGFRFIVQGDFEVPSSREAIVNGSEWNQWLVSQVPALMQHAVACFVDELRAIGACNSDDDDTDVFSRLAHLLALLPFEHEIQAPFRSVVRDMMRAVSQTPLLPVQQPRDVSDLELVPPIQVLDAWDAVSDDDVLDVLTRDGGRALRATLQKQLLHVTLSKLLTPQQKTQLRVERLTASHVLQLLAHAGAQNDVQWSVDMLRILARVWTKDRHAELLLQELRLIKCFPLQHGRRGATGGDSNEALHWVSLADVGDALFLPTVSDSQGQQLADRDSFHGDLHVLHDVFARAVNELPDARVFLRMHVKVKTIEDHDLIAHHILPRLEALASGASDAGSSVATIEQLPSDIAMSKQYVAFLASHLRRCGSSCAARAEIRAKMRVCTTAGQLVAPANVFVLLPSAARALSAFTTWLQVRLREASGSNSKAAAISIVALDLLDGGDALWRELFIETLGMPVLLDVTDSRIAAALKQVLKWLAAEADTERKQTLSAELATYLDKHWPVSTRPNESSIDPEVVELLRKSKWLGGSDGQFHRAHKLWTATPVNKALFSDSMVPYSRIAWSTEALAFDVLRLKRAPTLDDALKVLSRLASESATATHTQMHTLDDIARIYQFLSEQAQRSVDSAGAITRAFSERALLFAPSSGSHASGGFVTVQDVVWASTAYSSHLVALEQSYPAALRHFFTDVCGVARKPSVAALCARVVQLRTFASALDAKKQWRREVLPICRFFAKQIRKAALAKDEMRAIRRALKATPWLPTATGRSSALLWRSAKDAPLVAFSDDEREVLKLVLALRKESGTDLECERLQLVKLDAELLDELQPLLKLTKIRSLTAHVVSSPSVWCDFVVGAVGAIVLGAVADGASARRRVLKLLKRLVVAWAKAFAQDAAVWTKADAVFQTKLQRSAVLPSLRGVGFEAPADVFVNDQTELSMEQVANGGSSDDTAALPILSLFPWGYFTDASSSSQDTERADEAARVRTFLLTFCGAKSLKTQLAYEVVVLGSQQQQQQLRESAALRGKLQQSLGVAQRVLFHHHRTLYDALPHAELLTLSRDVRCVVVPGVGSLQVVYRVGACFSIRHVPSASFLDAKLRTLYVVQRADEDVVSASFHDVLLEVSRKCFGARVAASVANVLYLASLQPSAEATDKWLVDTQQLAAVDTEQAGALWAPTPLLPGAGDPPSSLKKRSLSSLEDGEVEDDGAVSEAAKRLRKGNSEAPTATPWSTGSASGVFPPLPPSDSSVPPQQQHRPTGMYPPPPLPPGGTGGFNANTMHLLQHLQQQQQPGGGAFQPPLPPPPPGPGHGSGVDQIVNVGNSMSKAEREGIGRWGEEYVYKQLVANHKDDADINVEWVNEHDESGKPYDITVSSRGKVVEYVEVKATRTMEKAVFEISMNELDQAAVHGSSYCIYRVFNAGNAALCRVVRMKNPVALVRQKKMQLALVMQ